MNLKSTLKTLKLNESTISMILGALVIVVVGLLVVNYFRNSETGNTFPDSATTENESAETDLPTTHVVASGESLWTISELYYGSGYNWIDIKDANELGTGDINEGQELVIPAVESRDPLAVNNSDEDIVTEPTPTATIQPPSESPVATVIPSPASTPDDQEIGTTEEEISEDRYTVVHGDTLWDIAVRAYGDGYRWVEIASANDLVNPDLIHPGNSFVIPR